jgi:hypothetical protein
MAKAKATTKQQGKAAIKPVKPKGNSKPHGVPPKKTGNSRKQATSDGSDNDDDPSSGDKL